MSVLRPRLLRQDGVCLASAHDLHQHVQGATVHAEGDRECRGLTRFALLLHLFDAAAAPPDLMHRQEAVGGSFSARVPRSSAEVRRGFVHHIVEVEVVGQKEEQGNQREGEEGEEVNGDVEAIRETHNAHEP